MKKVQMEVDNKKLPRAINLLNEIEIIYTLRTGVKSTIVVMRYTLESQLESIKEIAKLL